MSKSRNRKYWEQRAVGKDERNERAEQDGLRAVRRLYDNTQQRITARIDRFYNDYSGDDGAVSMADMRSLLTPSELVEYRDTMLQMRRSAVTEAEREQIRKCVERLRISREQALMSELDQYVNELSHKLESIVEKTSTDVYRNAELHAQYDMEQYIGLAVAYDKIDARALDVIIRRGWDGKDFSSKIWHNRDQLVRNLHNLIPQQFILGKSTRELSRDLAKAMDTTYYNAARVIRTEAAYVSAQADVGLYKDIGLKEYEFIATLDDRTSDTCQEMDGRVFKLSQMQPGVNAPPLHPNCRSTTIPVVDTDGLTGMRLAKDANGNYYTVPKMAYERWERTRDDLEANAAYKTTGIPRMPKV